MSSSSAPPEPVPGVHTIPPPRPCSPATAGIRLNHLMLRIADPVASLKFYNDFLGLHTIFIFNTGAWTIYYLGPRDIQIADIGTTSGLLELYYIQGQPGKGNSYGGGKGKDGEEFNFAQGFGHLGFTVPSVADTLERAREFGYRVVKPLDEAGVKDMGVHGLKNEESVVEGYKFVFRQLAFVLDPDGYWVELVPQKVIPPPEETQMSLDRSRVE